MSDVSLAAPLSLGVFVGTKGRGSNLRAINEAMNTGQLSAQIAVVIGSKSDAPVIAYAHEAGLPVALIDPKTCAEPTAYADALVSALRTARADTVVLAGYLRRVPSAVLSAFSHRVINLHPSLLPAFGGKGMYGLHVHQAVLDYGAKVSGCTVHFVDETYDTGPVILQRTVPVLDTDTPETLAARILPEEHAALVDALRLLGEGRLRVDGRQVFVGISEDDG